MFSAIAPWFTLPFLQISLLVALAASLSGSLVGTYVVTKRITMIAGTLSHAVLGGMGACLYMDRVHGLSCPPLWGALVSALLISLLLGWLHRHHRQREDAVMSIIWAVGMAIGIILISCTPGSNVDILSFLFGNLLWVDMTDLALLGGLCVSLFVILWLFHRRFTAICFDADQAELQGIAVGRTYQLLLMLIAVTVVVLTAVVGSVLVLSLLTLPPCIAALFQRRIMGMMVTSCVIGCSLCLMGLFVSYPLDWPPGATIALLSGVAYGFALLVPYVRAGWCSLKKVPTA